MPHQCHDVGDKVPAFSPMHRANFVSPESIDVRASGIQNPPNVSVRELTLQDSVGISLGMQMSIGDKEVFGNVDSAAQITVVSSQVFPDLHLSTAKSELVRIKNAQTGSAMDGYLVKSVHFLIRHKTYTWDVVVVDISDELLLGLDFLKAHSAKLDFERNTITLQGEVICATLKKDLAGNSFQVNCASVAK